MIALNQKIHKNKFCHSALMSYQTCFCGTQK